MNYLDALREVEIAAEHKLFTGQVAIHQPGWRLWLRKRSREADPVQVELQHQEGTGEAEFWNSVANVSCNIGIGAGGVQLYTGINCTICGRWSDYNSHKGHGLQRLFEIADMFEEFTAGKVFES